MVCLKFLGQIESAFLFRVSLLSSMFLIYSALCHYSVVGSVGLTAPVPDLAPGECMLASQLGRVQEVTCFCCQRAVVRPCPSSSHYLCAQLGGLLTLFLIESGSVPSQGLCPCSLCLEYFVQDSL